MRRASALSQCTPRLCQVHQSGRSFCGWNAAWSPKMSPVPRDHRLANLSRVAKDHCRCAAETRSPDAFSDHRRILYTLYMYSRRPTLRSDVLSDERLVRQQNAGRVSRTLGGRRCCCKARQRKNTLLSRMASRNGKRPENVYSVHLPGEAATTEYYT